jgi:DHA2 family multidrug resistance protein
VDLRVLKHRSPAAGSAYSMLLGMGLYGVMFAIPIFLQVYLGFTALQSGLTLFPGAVGSAVMMMVLSKVAGRVDARLLIACGAFGMGVTALLLARMSPDTGTGSLFFPLILRGLTTTMMFLPLSLATLGSLPKKAVAHGAGFYNLTRQMGSSIGIAVITTLIAHREAVHRAVLVEKVTPYAAQTTERVQMLTGAFLQRGADPVTAHQRALGALDRIVNGQAMLLSFDDVFRYTAMAFIVTLPLLLLLGKGGNKEAAAAAH